RLRHPRPRGARQCAPGARGAQRARRARDLPVPAGVDDGMEQAARPTWREALFNRRMLACAFIGFSAGLPYFVVVSLLPAWLRTEHVDLKSIGLLTLVGFPYTWKFVWSPLMDRFALPLLGRRRG